MQARALRKSRARKHPSRPLGDEIGLSGGADHDNPREDFPGGWKEDARNAFTPAGRGPDEQAVVFLNNGAEAVIEAPVGPTGLGEGAQLEDRLQALPPLKVANGHLRVALPGWSGAIYAPAVVKP